MRWQRAAAGWAVFFVAGFVAQASPASAQTFDSYRCADGTHFILAFYPSDKRAYLQIDGRPVTLKRGLAVSAKHYSGGGVSLVMTATGALIKHLRRPATACELS
jgi:hypothetical protein